MATGAVQMSQSVAQLVANVAVDLNDAFELDDDELPAITNVRFLHDHRAATPTPATLSECVPLLTIAREFIDRGPETLTIDGIERYRQNAARFIEHVRPVIERKAGMTLADWAAERLGTTTPERA